MNELESILNYLETTSLEPHDDYTSEFTYKEQKMLWNYIKQLKEQLEASEKARKEAIKYINVTEYSGIVGLNKNGIKEFWFVKDLLKILSIDKGE